MKCLCIEKPLAWTLLTVALLLSGEVSAAPAITAAVPALLPAGAEISLTGSGFGAASAASEVVADYGHGFFYTLKYSDWNDRTIRLRIPDLGKSLTPQLRVVKGRQYSNSVRVTIRPDIRSGGHGESRAHQLGIGDKGEDIFKVINHPPTCGNVGQRFDHAEIIYDKKRFAEAQFVALPARGCSRCGAIKVHWYNEPTGSLQYRMKIFRRQIEGVCRQMVRRLKKS